MPVSQASGPSKQISMEIVRYEQSTSRLILDKVLHALELF